MLCINLFISQLTFLIGIDQTRYKVRKILILAHFAPLPPSLPLPPVPMHHNIYNITVHVFSNVYVDVDGGRGLIRYTS